MDVVKKIESIKTSKGDMPLIDVIISDCGVIEVTENEVDFKDQTL